MAIKIEELQVLISANADQFKGELLSIKHELRALNATSKQTGDAVGNNLTGSIVKANIASGLIVRAFGAIFNGSKQLTGAIIANGSAFSRMTVATETVASNLGITREELQGLRDDLAETNTFGIQAENVIRTLAMSGLVQMAKQLKAVDARTGETVTGVSALTLSMKDLAAAAGVDSSVGIERLAKFIQRGEASFADGLIELGNLNIAYQEYAKQNGITLQQMGNTERAIVRLNIVTQEGAKTFGAYANTYESSGKIISSIGMLMKGITEQIGSGLEPVLRVGSTAILMFFRGIQTSVFQADDAIRSFANRLAGYMLAIARMVGRALSGLPLIGKNFQNLANLTLKPIQAQGKLSDALGATAGGMNNAAKGAAKLSKELKGLAGFDELNILSNQDTSGGGVGAGDMSGIGGGGGINPVDQFGIEDSSALINKFADDAGKAFSDLTKKIKDFIKPFTDIKIFGMPVLDLLGEIVKILAIAKLAFMGVSVVVGVLSGMFGAFGALGFILAGLAAIFLDLWNNNEQFRNSITEVARIVGEFLITSLQNLWTVIQQLVEGGIRVLGDVMEWLNVNIFQPFVKYVQNVVVPVIEIMHRVIKTVIDVFIEIGKIIAAIVVPAIEILVDIFRVAVEYIWEVITAVWEQVLQPVFNSIGEAIARDVVPMLEVLGNAVQEIGKVFGKIFGEIRRVVEVVMQALRSSVGGTVDWFRNNIVNRIGDFVGAVIGLFGKIGQAASSVWGGVSDFFVRGVNGVIGIINTFIRSINNLINGINKIGGLVGIQVGRIGEIGIIASDADRAKAKDQTNALLASLGNLIGQSIPKLATGGIVSSPTLAMIGENGREAVIPLENNTEWIDQLAERLGDRGGQNITVKIGEETIYNKFVDYINDRSTASGAPIINI